MHTLPLTLEQNGICTEFDFAGGGFPTQVIFKENNDLKTLLIENATPQLQITLGDGTQVSSFIPANCPIHNYRISEGAQRIEFPKLLFMAKSGEVINNFQMSLRHEFWPDGTVFSNAFFMVEDNDAPHIESFELCVKITFSAFDKVRWAFFPKANVGSRW